MFKYALKRILIFIPTLLLISLITFIINLSAPGDPVQKLMTSADSEGAAGKSAARQKEMIEKRAELGLDKPVFYLGIQTLAHPDTLHLVLDKNERIALGKLVRKYGNWEGTSKYYHSIKDALTANSTFNIDSVFQSGIDTLVGVTASNGSDSVVERYSRNDLMELQSLTSVNLIATSQAWKDEVISASLDTLVNKAGKEAFYAPIHAHLVNVQTHYAAMKDGAKKWKTYIPKFSWNGFGNQYHHWLLGNVPFFSSKESRKNKLVSKREDLLSFLKENESLITDKAALESQINETYQTSKANTYFFAQKSNKEFGSLTGFYSFLSSPRILADNHVNEQIELYGQAIKANPTTSEDILKNIKKKELSLENISNQVNYPRYGMLRGDFGISLDDGLPIRKKIAKALPWSLWLAIITIILAYLIAIPIGIYSAYKANGVFDRITSLILYILYSLPGFWVATILLMSFANPDALNWFPSGGTSNPETFNPDWNIFLKIKHYIPF